MPESGLDKSYQPAAHESRITERWTKSRAFHADPSRVLQGQAAPYCVLIPPPNVTGALHLGHGLNNTLQDILVRSHRMMGDETLWIVGTDHAGIATQAVVEKRLLKEEGKRRKDYSREEFVGLVWKWKDEYEKRITGQLVAMGCSCDFERQRFTMDDICARAVREAFFILFRDGLIYRGKRLVNWDTVLQTAVADDECYDEEIDTNFWYMRYPLEAPVTLPSGETIEHVTVATTRPETYLGDTAVAMNPTDPRAKALEGKHVILPLVGRRILIVLDDYVVLPAAMAETEEARNDPKAAYATGFLKVTPAHDKNDEQIGLRHKLQAINMMSPDGRVSDRHGWSDFGEAKEFVGMTMAEGRKAVAAKFKAMGLLEEVRPYRQTVSKSDRSGAVIEPYLSDQWYVRVTDDRLSGAANRSLVAEQRGQGQSSKEQMTKGQSSDGAAGDGSMRFYPSRYAKTFEHWHENIRDWCISRQLWWGHRIPVWSAAQDDGDQPPMSLGFTKQLGTWQAEDRVVWQKARAESRAGAVQQHNVCVRDESDAALIAQLEAEGFCRDPDVLDTWFSSALWPLSTLGWPDPEQSPETAGLLEAFNPTSVLSTAREIITLWVSRMTMMNRYLLGTPTLRVGSDAISGAESHRKADAAGESTHAELGGTRSAHAELGGTQRRSGRGDGPVPFRDVFIHAVVQDGEGRKMSKSLGNGVDPLDIISSHGADAMRFTLCQMTTQTQDVRMPVVHDPATGKNTSPKFDLGRNFCNKLWNAARFTLSIFERAQTGDPGSSGGPGSPGGPGGPGIAQLKLSQPIHAKDLSLIDRWMLSRLASSVLAVEACLKNYEFSEYADVVYKLLWWDLCDWYLEGIKPSVHAADAAGAGQRIVLATALETVLRLLHPITPFVTEAIWEQTKHLIVQAGGLPEGGIEGVKLEGPRTGDLLCSAGWPRFASSLVDPAAEAQFEYLRLIVNQIRNIRSEHQVPPKRKLVLHVPATVLQELGRAPGLVETLAGLEKVEMTGKLAAGSVGGGGHGGGGASVAIRIGGHECLLTNLADAIDSGAESERLSKQLEQLKKSEAALNGRLSNPGYADKAPAKLVEESRSQLAKLREEIAAVQAKLGMQ